MTRILVIPGSARRGSLNATLANCAVQSVQKASGERLGFYLVKKSL